MSNEQLVILIKAGEDVAQNMEQLYFQVKGFIHTVAWSYRGIGELEDLEQEGYLALYPAIDGYDPERGVKFLTYAENWIRQRIVRYIQNSGSCLRLPVHCLEDMRRYERFVSDFSAACGREPSDAEIRHYLGLTMEQVREIRANIRKASLGSLDSPVAGPDGPVAGISSRWGIWWQILAVWKRKSWKRGSRKNWNGGCGPVWILCQGDNRRC